MCRPCSCPRVPGPRPRHSPSAPHTLEFTRNQRAGGSDRVAGDVWTATPPLSARTALYHSDSCCFWQPTEVALAKDPNPLIGQTYNLAQCFVWHLNAEGKIHLMRRYLDTGSVWN